MALLLKRIDAGGIQIAALYNRRSRYDTPAQRAAKEKVSSEAQRRMNQIYSWQKLELLLSMYQRLSLLLQHHIRFRLL